MYKIHLLPAEYGDAILVEWGEKKPCYMLIDGGPYFGFDAFAKAIFDVAPDLKEIDLLVITHIDTDHIDGIVTLLNHDEQPFVIKDIWFNGYKQLQEVSKFLGPVQGEYITKLIEKKGLPHNKSFDGSPVYVNDFANLPHIKLAGGMKLMLLGPGVKALQRLEKEWIKKLEEMGKDVDIQKELDEDHRYKPTSPWLGDDMTVKELQEKKVTPDKSAANGSSIAFVATYKNKSCLFAGDLTTAGMLEAIEPILAENGNERFTVDAWKLSHHGSKKSTMETLMEKIDCKQLLVSSNGKYHEHPDGECIAKLLKNNGPDLAFYFNYKTSFTEWWDDEKLKETYGYETHFPEGEGGITLSLL